MNRIEPNHLNKGISTSEHVAYGTTVTLSIALTVLGAFALCYGHLSGASHTTVAVCTGLTGSSAITIGTLWLNTTQTPKNTDEWDHLASQLSHPSDRAFAYQICFSPHAVKPVATDRGTRFYALPSQDQTAQYPRYLMVEKSGKPSLLFGEQIGEGGRGQVFKNREGLVIKIAKENGKREAKLEHFVLSQLWHHQTDLTGIQFPVGLHRIKDHVITTSRLYNMGSLYDETSKKWKALSINEAIHVSSQLVKGLKHAHTLGLAHGDINVQNVFLHREEDGTLNGYLADWGEVKNATESTVNDDKKRLAYFFYDFFKSFDQSQIPLPILNLLTIGPSGCLSHFPTLDEWESAFS